MSGKAEEKTVYAYEVFPINFNLLPDEKQAEVVERFKGFLNALSRELRIHVVKSKKAVDLGGESFEATYYRFFMESLGSPIDHLLTHMGLRYQRVTEVEKVEPVKVFPKFMALPEGRLMKAFTIYALPGSLVEGFITETYGAVDRVLIEFKPLPPEQAVRRIDRYAKLIGGLRAADVSKGRSVPKEVELKVAMVNELHDKLIAGLARLFEVKANLCVSGKDKAELRANERTVKEVLQARLVRVDSPSYLQYEMALGDEGKRLFMDTDTAACFFPFISEDVIETPGGIFLGFNTMTGAPVIYDPLLRMNQNIMIIGRAGAGKCISGDTMVVDADTGVMLPIRQIVEERKHRRILTLAGNYKLDKRPVDAFHDNGEQDVYEVRTRIGRKIKATANHPFLTIDGWKACGQLKPGDRIATPRVIPVFGDLDVPDYQLVVLAHVLGNGCCVARSVKVICRKENLKELIGSASKFPFTQARIRQRKGAFEVTFTAKRLRKPAPIKKEGIIKEYNIQPLLRERRNPARTEVQSRLYRDGLTLSQIAEIFHVTPEAVAFRLKRAGVIQPVRKSGVRTWLEELGLFGKRSTEKEIPQFVFRLRKEKLALFLNRLFACDGWMAACKDGRISIGYSSSSRKMAEQVQHLLLRFGVVAKFREKQTKKRPSYMVEISNTDMVKRFIQEIGNFGREGYSAVKALCEGRRSNPNVDTVPRSVWRLVREAKRACGKTWVDVGRALGYKSPKSFTSCLKRCPSRETLRQVALVFNSKELLDIAASDVFWDEVESVTYSGREKVYDLTVVPTHNFVANDIIVHNSFTSKVLLSRLTARHRNLAFFIIDPENEYGHVGRMLGAEVVDVQPGKLMGLDPVQIFAESKDTAAAIIADIARVREEELYDELRNVVGVSDTIFDVFMNASQELKKRLRNLVDGADRFLVAGDPLPFTRRMVFNLQALHRAYQLSPERSVTLQAANVLIFSKIWQMIDNPQFIPLQDPKLVIVDEVWMYLTMPAAARFLEGVARRGRKRNVIFAVNTQRASDVLEGAGGRALAENCATKILMRQDESAIKNVGETFRLSSYEMDAVLEFEPGQAILVAEDVHIPVRFMATRDEYALFTTKPAERLI